MSSFRSLALLLIGSATAFSQPPPQPPGVPIPGAPQPPAGAPAGKVPQPGVPLGDTRIIEPIEERKLSGESLAGLYSKYTGRRVIVSAAAATAEFIFVQDASPQNPLTYRQAADLLKKAATIENFIFVPDATDPNLDILTLATGTLRPTNRGVPVYNENDPLPEGDAVISYVMTLSFIKPDEVVRTFTTIVGQLGAFGTIAPVPNASAVIITENTSLIRKLIDLKKEIDKPSSQVATRFITVQYADVTELATTLTELLTAQQSAQTTAGVQRADNNTPPPNPQGNIAQAPGGTGAPGASASGEQTPVQILPDARTNRIFAMGRPVDLLFVEGLVREFDTQTSDKNFLRRKLKFLKVGEFLPIAGEALTRAFTGTGNAAGAQGGQGGAQGTQGNRAGQQSGQGQTQAGNRGANANAGGGAFGGGNSSSGGGGGAGSGTGGGNALSDPSVSSAPESMLVGRTLLVADNITNSIVAQGPPAGLEIIERLLDQVDVKADQVMISTVFGQLTLTDQFQFGMDYLVRSDNFAGRGGGGFGPDLPVRGNITREPLAGSGLSLYGSIGGLDVYLRALQENSNFTILSRPSVFTSNNVRGVISSGRRIAVPTNSFQGGTNSGGQSTNIEYRDVVLKLEVIPLVNSDEEITLQIALLNDEVVDSQIIDDNEVPIIGTREILTTVTVPNNQTIVLGGLITTSDTDSVTGIPILSSIPGIGKLFSTTIKGKDRSELMIFIQPSIVNSGRTLDAVQTDMDSHYKVSGEIRRFGDGPGVLPPPNAIVPVDEKGRPLGDPVILNPAPEAAGKKAKRQSIRPVHRP